MRSKLKRAADTAKTPNKGTGKQADQSAHCLTLGRGEYYQRSSRGHAFELNRFGLLQGQEICKQLAFSSQYQRARDVMPD